MLKWSELTQAQKDDCAARAETLRTADRLVMAGIKHAEKGLDFEVTAQAAADAFKAGAFDRAADLIGALRQVVKAARHVS